MKLVPCTIVFRFLTIGLGRLFNHNLNLNRIKNKKYYVLGIFFVFAKDACHYFLNKNKNVNYINKSYANEIFI